MMKRIGMLILIVFCLCSVTGCTQPEKEGRSEEKDSQTDIEKQGGVRIVYQAKETTVSPREMEAVLNKLQKRAELYSTDAKVLQQNDRQLIVEIPGAVEADEIVEKIGKPGSLEFAANKADGSGLEIVLTGKDIKSAKKVTQESMDGDKEYAVQLVLTEEGTRIFGEVTMQNIGEEILIMYDGQEISRPRVNSAIIDGKLVITGMENSREAEELASLIRIGRLEVELEEVHFETFSKKK